MQICNTCRSADPQFCNGGCQSETPEQADMNAALETGDLVADFGGDDYETYAGTMPLNEFWPIYCRDMRKRRSGCRGTIQKDGQEHSGYGEAGV